MLHFKILTRVPTEVCLEKDLKNGLADRTSKSESKSIAFKSKSSKNGLKSGLESKSGLEYYKSVFS